MANITIDDLKRLKQQKGSLTVADVRALKARTSSYQAGKSKSKIANAVDRNLLKFSNAAANNNILWRNKDLAGQRKTTAGKLAMSIPETFIDLPGNLVENVFKGYGKKHSMTDVVKRGAHVAENALDISTVFTGAGIAKPLLKQGMKASGARGLANLFVQGTKAAAPASVGYGAAYGGLNALQEGRLPIADTIKGGAYGLLAAPLGGIAPIVGKGIGKLKRVAPERVPEIKQTSLKPENYMNPKTGQINSDGFIKDVLKAGEGGPENFRTGFYNTKIRPHITTGSRMLNEMGPEGQAFGKLLKDADIQRTRLKGRWTRLLVDHVKPLSEKSKLEVHYAMLYPKRIAKLNTEELTAFKALDSVRKEVYNWAKKNKIKMTDKDGRKLSWTGQDPDRYFPRYYEDKITKSESFKKAFIAKLKDQNPSMSTYDAEKEFRRWSEDHMVRKAGFEYQRDFELSLPGQVTDPFKVFSRYIEQTSRRIPEIGIFGQQAEKIVPLLKAMASKGYDTSLASKMYERLYAIGPRNAWIDAAMKFNVWSKLSLGFFINTTQQANIINSYGFKNWASVYKDYLLHPGKRRHMKDTAILADAYEQMIMVQEGGFSRDIITDVAMYPFKKSEELNRFVAANAGERYVKEVVGKLKKQPKSYFEFEELKGYEDDIMSLAKKYGKDPKYQAQKTRTNLGDTIDDRFYARIADDHFSELKPATQKWLMMDAPGIDFEAPDGGEYRGFLNAPMESSGNSNIHAGQITLLKENKMFALMDSLEKDPYASRSAKTALRALERLGIDPDSLLKGHLSPDDLQRAAYKAVENTQFRIDPLNLPPSWRGNVGRLITQFKSFSYMQTRYLRDEILGEAAQGNFAPIIRYLATAPLAYWAAMWLRDRVTLKAWRDAEREKDMNPAQKAKEDYDNLIDGLLRSTASLPADVLNNLMYLDKTDDNYYKSDLEKTLVATSNLLGPTFGEASNALSAAIQSGTIAKENKLERPENQINPYNYPVGKFLAPKVPFVGPALKNYFYGEFPEKQRVAFKKSLYDAVKSGDQARVNAIMEKNMSKHNVGVLKDVIREISMENLPKEERDAYDAIRKQRSELNYSIID